MSVIKLKPILRAGAVLAVVVVAGAAFYNTQVLYEHKIEDDEEEVPTQM